MNRSINLIAVLLVLACGTMRAQSSGSEVIRNLKPDWLVAEKGGFSPAGNRVVRKIFFTLDASVHAGNRLCISDDQPFAVFVDHQLLVIQKKGMVCLKIDSLGKLYASHLKLSVFQEDGVTTLQTFVEGPHSLTADEQNLFPRKGNYFLDFSLSATLLMFAYLVFLIRTNPRLTIDYLNVAKLFSAMAREDMLLTGRIASRVNLLFYVFCSLLCALILQVVFHLSHYSLPLSVFFIVNSTSDGFVQWMKLSVLVAVLLFLKLVILIAFSTLFHLRDKVSIQFFNFIRSLYLAGGFLAVVCLMNFVMKGPNGGFDLIWIKMSAGVLVFAALMMFIKLLALTRYHFFHLFSYLCASEIIPLLILLKILLY